MATVEQPAQPDDGPNVAPRRDPDLIAREIEETRAELANSVDTIADRVSPKNLLSEYGLQLAKVGAAIGVFFLLMALIRRRRSR